MVGLSLDFLALLIAASIASTSLPSATSKTSHSLAKNLALTCSEKERSKAPSRVTWLASYKRINLLSLRWPANEIASWEIPSCKQPSPHKGQKKKGSAQDEMDK